MSIILPITTARLTLRTFRPDDAPALANLIGNWNVIRWLKHPTFPYTLVDAEGFIARILARDPGEGSVAAAIARDDHLLGSVGLNARAGGLTLAYWLGEPYWGNGYMTEAAAALVHAAFAQTSVREIVSGYLEGNTASAGVLTKLGFEPTGVGTRLSTPLAREVVHYDMMLPRGRYRTLSP